MKDFKHLYIHIPFCANKCDYCAFYSETNLSDNLFREYLKKISLDIEKNLPYLHKIETIFIGGGTPTYLSNQQLIDFFSILNSYNLLENCREITIESNPETLDKTKVDILESTVNRVSLGVQSFNEKSRNIIGRKGSLNSVYRSIELLTSSKISNLSFDLIYGIPGQTINDWVLELEKLMEFDINHFSAYSLSIDSGSKLSKCNLDINNELAADMWEIIPQVVASKQFQRYEVSNYCVSDSKCIHNNSIWHGETYLGIGPAAVSFNGDIRYENTPNLKNWLAGAEFSVDKISSEERAREIFIMGLRTTEGWRHSDFNALTGFDYRNWLAPLEKYNGYDFFTITDSGFKLTANGLAFWDTIAEELIL
jgi:oxygen-independent coproporphyrinogen-3 oxidase